MDSLGSFALAFDVHTTQQNKRESKERLFSTNLVKNLVVHCIYQVLVIWIVLLAGPDMFPNVSPGYGINYNGTPAYNLVSNT